MPVNNFKKSFQSPAGMYDVLPEDQIYWEKVFGVVGHLATAYGFRRIETPVLEDMELFNKTNRKPTETNEKEIYVLKAKGSNRMAIRPELTTSVLRAYLGNGFKKEPHPVKIYSSGQVFYCNKRIDKEYRQSYQADFEVIGRKDAVIDVQLIQLLYNITYKELGLKNLMVHINSIGCSRCRNNYKKSLSAYLKRKRDDFCTGCQAQLVESPFRVLTCVNGDCQDVVQLGPQIIDSLCDDCCSHFKKVLDFLDELEIPYLLDGSLIGEPDYYTKTVFRLLPENPEENQSGLANGGRYDDLIGRLGNKKIPAAGFSLALDRIVNLLKKRGLKVNSKKRSLVYIVQLGDLGKKKSLGLFENLRKSGIDVAASFVENRLDCQLKEADTAGARFSLVIGQKEALDESVLVRDMKTGAQEVVPAGKIIKELKRKLKS